MGALESLPVQRIRPVLYAPLWTGTLLDESGNGNHLTAVNSIRWGRYKGRDGVISDGNGILRADADTSLEFDEITIMILGHFDHQDATQYFVKTAAAGGVWFYASTTTLRFWDGSAASFVNTSFVGAQTLCVRSQGGAQKPEFFVDGASVGLGSATSSQSIPSSNWYLAGDAAAGGVRDPISAAVIYNGLLTNTEIQTLSDYLTARRSPVKQWSGLTYAAPYASADTALTFDTYFDRAVVSVANESGGHRIGESTMRASTGVFQISEDSTTRERRLVGVSPGTCESDCAGAYGTWEIEYEKTSASSLLYFSFMADRDGENFVPVGYQLVVSSTESLLLRRITGGGAVTIRSTVAGFIELGVRYRFRVVRSAANLWSWYIRGGAYADWTEITTSNTDATYTTCSKLVIDLDATDLVYYARHFQGELIP